MRIAQINVVSSFSTGRIAVQLCRLANAAGHRTLLCHSRDHAPSDIASYRVGSRDHALIRRMQAWFARRSNLFCRLAAGALGKLCSSRLSVMANTYLHIALARLTDRAGFFSRGATRRLVRQLRRFKPDLIHLHNLHGYYLHLPTLFKYLKEQDIPVVWTLHDCWAYTGHCAYYTMAKNAPPLESKRRRAQQETVGCDRWTTGCGQCVLKRSYPASLWRDQSARNWQQKREMFCGVPHMVLTTPSEWLRDEVLRSFLKNYPVYALPNGVDLSVFTPCADGRYMEDVARSYGLDGIGERRLVLSVAAVWDERKGLADLIELAEKLGPEYCVAAVGLDEYQIAALPKNTVMGVRRTGNVNDLCALYTAADVYVSTSREETMGMTLVEALACGTQVICYDATAMPEIVTEDVGEVVPVGDTDALAEAVRRLCDNPKSDADCLSRAEDYESGQRFQAYIRLYENMYRHSPAYQDALEKAAYADDE